MPFAVFAALLAALYLFGPPLLILFTQKFPRTTQVIPFDDSARLPASIRDYLDACRLQLEELGFEPVGRLALPSPLDFVKAFVEMYADRKQRDAAMVSVLYGMKDGALLKELKYVEFLTRLKDGELALLQTNNADEVNAFPPQPDERTFKVPTVQEVARLHALHRTLLALHAGAGRAYLRLDDEFRGDAAAYLAATFPEAYAQQEKRGWFRFDARGDCWRPTVYGAFRLTWQELWPMNRIRQARMRLAGRRLLTELAIEPTSS